MPAQTHDHIAPSDQAAPTERLSNEVFVVDDDPDMRDVLALFLSEAGFHVTTFEDGRSVIRAAQTAVPACILMDMYLVNETGVDILRQLGAESFAAPVLMISGRNDIRTTVAALQNGACAFLEKQMDAETIVTRVRKTVDTWPH